VEAGPNNFGLIIGAMKCGTSTLYRYLIKHPVAACRWKEPGFFSADENWARGMGWYRGLWGWEPSRHRIAVEASTHYTKLPTNPHVVERIARVGIPVKFIYIMRHPVDRIESQALHDVYDGWAPPPTEGISELAISISKYAMQLDAYQRFGREKLLLLYTHELARDPHGVLRTVCEFLGIVPEYDLTLNNVRANTRDERLARKDPPSWARLKKLKSLSAVAQIVPSNVRSWARRRLANRLDARCRLTSEQRQLVVQRLRPDLVRLRDEYGVDAAALWGISLSAPSTLSLSGR
jgi:hypothetical protein